MNDPTIDAKRKMSEKGANEGDTCRICRGEGSQEEPLFYPCKCSGSIKFVHQACLMEWLSHSQKKHCELCKTPFRFTKLYDPHMPTSVPLKIFLKQAAFHVFSATKTWLRWMLVLFVWLGCVPWCMRTIWRGLFWLGDGAWISRQEFERYTRRLERFAAMAEQFPGNRTFQLSNSASNSSSVIAGLLPKWIPVSQTLNITAREPVILWFAKRVLGGFLVPYTAMLPFQNASTNATEAATPLRSPTVLSNVKILRNLTRSNTLNNIVVDVLEGQLITLSIVVAFILVFLIREWVVQQQPMINVGGGAEGVRVLERPARRADRAANPNPNREDGRLAENRNRPNAQEANRRRNTDPGLHSPTYPATTSDNTEKPETELPSTDEPSPPPTTEDPVERRQIRRMRGTDFSLARSKSFPDVTNEPAAYTSDRTIDGQAQASGSDGMLTRPAMPTKDILAQAADIQRTLAEEAGASGELSPSIDVLTDYWNRADGDPGRALEIIEEEGQTEHLGWIVSFFQRRRKQQEAMDLTRHEAASQESSGSWQMVENSGTHDKSPYSGNYETSKPSSQVAESNSDSAQASLSGFSNASTTSSHDPIAQAPGSIGPEDSMSDDSSGSSHLGAPLPMPHAEREIAVHADEVPTFRARVRDWLWGGIPQPDAAVEDVDADDERVVQDLAEEAPFVPVGDGRRLVDEGEDVNPAEDDPQRDPEVARAIAEAGIDPNDVDAIEEGEDLEGIMELIGVQGPLGGLFQNGMFSTVLISMTVIFGVWVPYIVGKLMLVFVANPTALLVKMPLRWISTTVDMVVDTCIFLFGCSFYWLDRFVRATAGPFGLVLPFVQVAQQDRSIPLTAYRFTWNAAERLAKNFLATSGHFSDLDIPIFSIVAHESLRKIENFLFGFVYTVFSTVRTLVESSSPSLLLAKQIRDHAVTAFLKGSQLPERVIGMSASFWGWFSSRKNSSLFTISLDVPIRTEPFDYDLANWSSQDRAITIIVGYMFFAAAGAVYLKLRRFIKDFQPEGEQQDGVVIDLLNQAAGVLKVILIITIEMIVFPLYCGMLLDVALLPLFENATIVSRLMFTANSPMTSLFVHWFVGTCYMFHFALFVSMCRRIMRSGVLYFIRDPDDPSFHPVRDVLERHVSAQLRKILFSALVYGGLVIVCLGAVVWGVSSIAHEVFPIHWSSNEPVLEFPVDLLVYNFLMPVAIKFFKPSDGLQSMYKWWFRKCARFLRLSHFLFDDQRDDEQGHWESSALAIGKRLGLVPDTKAKSHAEVIDSEMPAEMLKSQNSDNSSPIRHDNGVGSRLVFVRDGRLVRAPASDQVRIPKGSRTFVEIDANGNRLDGLSDNHQGLHGRENKMFASIYVPPHFRLRIASFIVLLWLFAATTGVSLTILPLVFGRYIFSKLVPSHPRMNDVYAFAIGIYLLGGPIYVAVLYQDRISSSLQRISGSRTFSTEAIKSVSQRAFRAGLRFVRLLYFYGAFTLLLPSLLAFVFEAYLLVPIHTYFTRNEIPPVSHTIHFVSDWTLGVLWMRVGIRLMLRRNDTRPGRALRALVSPQNNGSSWFNPDIWLATRAFILPLLVVLGFALLIPLGFGWVLNRAWFYGASASAHTMVYRYSYPAVLFMILLYAFVRVLGRALIRWRSRVRDEVYLIGERLHNFGEKKARVDRVTTRV